jgi:AraC-like DNA-binding protein
VNSQLLFLAIDVAAVVCAVLLAARVLASYPRLPSAWLIAAIALGTVCNVVLGRYDYRYWIPAPFQITVGGWEPLLDVGRNVAPGLLMLLCHTVFIDGRRFPRWLLGLFVLQVLLDQPGRQFLHNPMLVQTLPIVLQTFFAGVSLYWTLASWRDDLSETRRRARMLTLAIVGLNTFVSGLLTLLVDQDSIASYFTHVGLVASYAAILGFVLFQTLESSIGEYLDPSRRPVPKGPRRADADTAAGLARLASLMEVDRLYRQPGLTLKELADAVGLPEYRARKLIHDELGFMSFNAYLHSYRIRDACAQLRDPALRRTPILTIALSVGYQSINTFNRGFREVVGMTPSAFRGSASTDPAMENPSQNLNKDAISKNW